MRDVKDSAAAHDKKKRNRNFSAAVAERQKALLTRIDKCSE